MDTTHDHPQQDLLEFFDEREDFLEFYATRRDRGGYDIVVRLDGTYTYHPGPGQVRYEARQLLEALEESRRRQGQAETAGANERNRNA